MSDAITSNIHEVLERFQRGVEQSDAALKAADAEANKLALRYAESIAPYRSGDLAESLHRVDGKTSDTEVTSSIEPGGQIYYSIYVMRLAHRSADHKHLDWVSRTVAERPDIEQTAERKGAEVLTDLLNGGVA